MALRPRRSSYEAPCEGITPEIQTLRGPDIFYDAPKHSLGVTTQPNRTFVWPSDNQALCAQNTESLEKYSLHRDEESRISTSTPHAGRPSPRLTPFKTITIVYRQRKELPRGADPLMRIHLAD